MRYSATDPYIYVKTFTLFTVHQPLTKKTKSPCMTCWAYNLTGYDFNILNKPWPFVLTELITLNSTDPLVNRGIRMIKRVDLSHPTAPGTDPSSTGPRQLRIQGLQLTHCSTIAAHADEHNTYENLQQTFYFSNMMQEIYAFLGAWDNFQWFIGTTCKTPLGRTSRISVLMDLLKVVMSQV